MWTTQPAQQRPRQEILAGPITITVGPHWSDEEFTQQQFSLYLTETTSRYEDECMRLWPHEAIRLARQALDEFEAWLEGQS